MGNETSIDQDALFMTCIYCKKELTNAITLPCGHKICADQCFNTVVNVLANCYKPKGKKLPTNYIQTDTLFMCPIDQEVCSKNELLCLKKKSDEERAAAAAAKNIGARKQSMAMPQPGAPLFV